MQRRETTGSIQGLWSTEKKHTLMKTLFFIWLFISFFFMFKGVPSALERTIFCGAKGPQEGISLSTDNNSGNTLIVFHDGRGVSTDIYGEIIDANGRPIKRDIPVFRGKGYQAWPSVCYNEKKGIYFVVWQENSKDGRSSIAGRFISRDGNPVGPRILIVKSTYYLGSPLILCFRGEGFLLLYYDGGKDEKGLKGLRLNRDGFPWGKPFLISSHAAKGIKIRASCNEEKGEFLIVWEDWRNGRDPDIYGMIIDIKGNPLSFDIPIATSSDKDNAPVVAFDPYSKRYLIVWERNSDIFGRFINMRGETEGEEFPICAVAGLQGSPYVIFDSGKRRFLVIWEDTRSGTFNIQGAWVDGNGKINEERGPFVKSPWMQVSPSAIFNRKSHSCLILWEEYIKGDWDIAGVILK